MARKPNKKEAKKAPRKGGRCKRGERKYRTYIAKTLIGIKGCYETTTKVMAIVHSFATTSWSRRVLGRCWIGANPQRARGGGAMDHGVLEVWGVDRACGL